MTNPHFLSRTAVISSFIHSSYDEVFQKDITFYSKAMVWVEDKIPWNQSFHKRVKFHSKLISRNIFKCVTAPLISFDFLPNLAFKNRVMPPTDGVTGDTGYFKRDDIKNKVVLFWIRHRPYVYHPWETKKLSFIDKTL